MFYKVSGMLPMVCDVLQPVSVMLISTVLICSPNLVWFCELTGFGFPSVPSKTWYGSSSVTRIESGKGIVSLFFSSTPYCVGIIQPDLLVLMSLKYIAVGSNVGDLIAVLGSIDFVLGSVDL